MADVNSVRSVALSQALTKQWDYPLHPTELHGQTAGKRLERITRDFLSESFDLLRHVRPGAWEFSVKGQIAAFDQYRHLAETARLMDEHRELKIALGDYLVKPDIIVARSPVSDEELNKDSDAGIVGTGGPPHHSPLRAANVASPTLHASISCKWTLRSDRSQNARTEGLNHIRNRKGHTPHIAVVTAEPLPNRVASLAMGTGDIDCVYHFALPELAAAVEKVGDDTAHELLTEMVNGRRLRDIADLPFDLAI